MEQMAATGGLARLQVFPGHPYLMPVAAVVALMPLLLFRLLAQAVLGVAARGQIMIARLPQGPRTLAAVVAVVVVFQLAGTAITAALAS